MTTTAAHVRAVLADLGAGRLDVDEAALRLRPVYAAAVAERAQREAGDPDAASTPGVWTEADVARWTGVITAGQYAALADRLATGSA